MAASSDTLPILLDPQNFTPLTRTPWAGNYIATFIKDDIVHDKAGKIGESWEFSCDPDFPSKLYRQENTVAQYLSKHRDAFFPNDPAANFEILLKVINAADDLSLQVHPDDANPNLKTTECGKPEAWLILHAQKGAGIYLGFKEKVSKSALREALALGNAKDLFQFVEVRAGDYFDIPAGVAHAVGKGVTLLEPQRVLFGKSGKTYRLWDWGRRYDSAGHLDMLSGKERQLHVEESLDTIDPEGPAGQELLNKLAKTPTKLKPCLGVTIAVFPANSYSQLYSLHFEAEKSVKITAKTPYAISYVLSGEIIVQNLEQEEASCRVAKGYSALWPRHLTKSQVTAKKDSHMVLILPNGFELSFS